MDPEARVAFYLGPLPIRPLDPLEHRLSVRDLARVPRHDPYGGDLYGWVRDRDPRESYVIHSGDTINPLRGTTVICKARRPGDYAVLAKLSQRRHWAPAYGLNDTVPWRDKRARLCWRGTALTTQRRHAVSLGLGIAACDIVPRHDMSMADMCHSKWLLSLEGRDVATNLKWIAASGSTLVMPPPTCDSWAMESTLKPWVHYVPLSPDLLDLEDTVSWLAEHDAEAYTIARASQHWFTQTFGDETVEARIQQQVLDMYQESQTRV